MFGDYTYGTEILALPMPEDEFVPSLDRAYAKADSMVQQTEDDAIAFDPTTTYWFRWVTGHQTMFIFWHLLTKELLWMKTNGLDAAGLDRCTQLLQGGASIFEYTGSCAPEYYHQYIRPFMALAHKGFSGHWALDYGRFPQLTKYVMQSDCPAALYEKQQAFRQAYLLHQKSHYSVAQRLVPSGTSLLKNAKTEGANVGECQAHHALFYDFFFLVHRTTVSCAQLEQSLWRRANAIRQDLQAYPLPAMSSMKENHLKILSQAVEAASEILQISLSRRTKGT